MLVTLGKTPESHSNDSRFVPQADQDVKFSLHKPWGSGMLSGGSGTV
jgi:hypothetical protein